MIWVFEKLFDKVEVFKPEASRMQSAEIFVVCLGFKAPNKIDPKFFNPKIIFQQNEADVFEQMNKNNINSLKKIFSMKTTKNLTYEGKMVQHKKITLKQFLNVENPFAVFVCYNQIDLSDTQFYNHIKGIQTPPDDFVEHAADIKLLGKREVSKILKWREKVQNALKKISRENKMNAQDNNEIVKGSEQIEEEKDGKEDKEIELEQNIAKKKLKKQERLLQRKKDKNYLQFINKRVKGEEVMNEKLDNEFNDFDFKENESILKKTNLLKEDDNNDIDEEQLELQEILQKKQGRMVKANSMKEMNDNLEHIFEQKKKVKMANEIHQQKVESHKKKTQGKPKEKKKFQKELFKEDENKDFDLEVEEINQEIDKEQLKMIKKTSKFYSKKIFSVLEDEDFMAENNINKDIQNLDNDGDGEVKKHFDSDNSDNESNDSYLDLNEIEDEGLKKKHGNKLI